MILSVVTGTYNRLSFLRNMVESVRKSIPPGLEMEFCVCDGGSTDGTLEWLETQPDVRVVKHTKLMGAIKAFNDAARIAAGDYLLIANDDIEFKGGSVARGLAFMMDNPDVGAGCYYQDRGGKEMHVEHMPMADGTLLPYIQVGLIPRWLWEKCGGWGDWYPGGTYGGDNYVSGRIYESGYKVVPIGDCCIRDNKANDALRKRNETGNTSGLVWEQFPNGIIIPSGPIYPNPLPEYKRVVYAPIIEGGYTVQKEQKNGLREALKGFGVVWEVDYIYSKESVVDAVELWQPHYVVTQFHTASSTCVADVRRMRAACQGHMFNFSGDVWHDQGSTEMMEILRYFDYHLTVNASLIQEYTKYGIRSAYWQNAAEPPVTDNNDVEGSADIVFIGNKYTQLRLTLAMALKSLPFDAKIYGRGYPDGMSEGESLYNYRRTGQIYRGAKIAIADNQYIEAIGFASDRLFMSLAAGGCMLMHQKVEGMEKLLGLVDGVHYVSWNDIADLKTKIAYYLSHEDERKRIADAGTLECRTKHSFSNRVNELKTLIKDLPSRSRTLSTCMIVKDAGVSIESLLYQVEQFSTEVIIVDTGSTDYTRDRVSDYIRNSSSGDKIKLFEFEWNNDFSEARNFARSKCTGDFIFWIDADEFLDTASLETMKKFSTWSFRKQGLSMPQAFKFPVVNYIDGIPEPQSCMQLRLFQNVEKVVWGGAVHEHDYLESSAKFYGLSFLCMSGVKIRHRVPASRVDKEARNLNLLMSMPESAWRSTYIAVSYAALERWGDAVIWFELAISQTEDLDAVDYLRFNVGFCFHKMGLNDQAVPRLKNSKFPDALFLLAELESIDGKFQVERYHDFLASPAPTDYPSFSGAWRETAAIKLRDYHWAEYIKLEDN